MTDYNLDDEVDRLMGRASMMNAALSMDTSDATIDKFVTSVVKQAQLVLQLSKAGHQRTRPAKVPGHIAGVTRKLEAEIDPQDFQDFLEGKGQWAGGEDDERS